MRGAGAVDGFRGYQGRGAPEMDLLELMTCPTADVEGLGVPLPPNASCLFQGTQVAPRLPPAYRPWPNDAPAPDQWYRGLSYHNHSSAGAFATAQSISFYGYYNQDTIGGKVAYTPEGGAPTSRFGGWHTVGMHLHLDDACFEPHSNRSADNKRACRELSNATFYLDGLPTMSINYSGFGRYGSTPPRTPPIEPMYIMLELKFWQWAHVRDEGFPYEFEVDYVRLYQEQGRPHRLECSPDDHPTRRWIDASHLDYGIAPVSHLTMLVDLRRWSQVLSLVFGLLLVFFGSLEIGTTATGAQAAILAVTLAWRALNLCGVLEDGDHPYWPFIVADQGRLWLTLELFLGVFFIAQGTPRTAHVCGGAVGGWVLASQAANFFPALLGPTSKSLIAAAPCASSAGGARQPADRDLPLALDRLLGAQLAAFGYWQHSGCDFGVLSAEDFAWSGPGCPCVPGTPGCLRDAVPGQPWWEPYVYLGTPLALFLVGLAYQLVHHVARGHLDLSRGSLVHVSAASQGYERHTDADDDSGDLGTPRPRDDEDGYHTPPPAPRLDRANSTMDHAKFLSRVRGERAAARLGDALYRIIGGREPLSLYKTRQSMAIAREASPVVPEPVEADDGCTELPALHAAAAVMAATLRLQPASVATQTAHLHALLRNARRGGKSEEDAVAEIADALLGNYRRWCARVGEAPRPVPQQPLGAAATAAWGANDCLLYLLLWGEAANLRHMPELIAWLYHHLAKRWRRRTTPWRRTVSRGRWCPSRLDGARPKPFMDDVILPIYNIAVQRMKEDKLTYDDLNEFFWSRDACVRDGWQPFRSRRNCIVHPLRTCAKTHAEMHSWLHVLACFGPVFFLTAAGMALLSSAALAANNGQPLGDWAAGAVAVQLWIFSLYQLLQELIDLWLEAELQNQVHEASGGVVSLVIGAARGLIILGYSLAIGGCTFEAIALNGGTSDNAAATAEARWADAVIPFSMAWLLGGLQVAAHFMYASLVECVPALRVLTTPYRVGRAQETFYGTPRARGRRGAAFWLVVAGVWAAGSYRLMDAPTIGGWDSIVGAYARGDAVFGEFILLLAALTLPLLPVSLVLLQITFELSVMVLAVVKGQQKSLDRHKPLTKVRKDDAELAAVRDAFLAKLVPPGGRSLAVIGIESPRDGAALLPTRGTRWRRACAAATSSPTTSAPPSPFRARGRPTPARRRSCRRPSSSRTAGKPRPALRAPKRNQPLALAPAAAAALAHVSTSSARSSSTRSTRWPPTRSFDASAASVAASFEAAARDAARLGRWTWANIDLHRGFGRLLECARRLAAALAAAPVAVDIDVAADDGWARLATPPPGGAAAPSSPAAGGAMKRVGSFDRLRRRLSSPAVAAAPSAVGGAPTGMAEVSAALLGALAALRSLFKRATAGGSPLKNGGRVADANVESTPESRAAAAAIAQAEEAARDAAAAARPLRPVGAAAHQRAAALAQLLSGAPVDRPACAEAVRRLKFFQSSLDMAMPDAPPLEAMDSVTVLTPAYKETVIFSVAELAEEGSGGESLLDVLRRLYADEWRFFCERTFGVARDVTIGDLQRKGGGADATAVRVWGAAARADALPHRVRDGRVRGGAPAAGAGRAARPLAAGGARARAHQVRDALRVPELRRVQAQRRGAGRRRRAPPPRAPRPPRRVPPQGEEGRRRGARGGADRRRRRRRRARALARRAAGDADHRRGQAREPEPRAAVCPRPPRDARRHEPGRLL